jgi:hypothetical protein
LTTPTTTATIKTWGNKLYMRSCNYPVSESELIPDARRARLRSDQNTAGFLQNRHATR